MRSCEGRVQISVCDSPLLPPSLYNDSAQSLLVSELAEWLIPDIESEEEDHEDAEHGAAVQPRHDPPVTPVQCQVP